jgi:diguanylate cyclase (GGDEF)-like protein
MPEPAPDTVPIRKLPPGALKGTAVIPAPPPRQVVRPDTYLVQIYPPGPTLGQRYRLGAEHAVVGRRPDVDILSFDPSVSGAHARVECRPDGSYLVTDLGSTNGTFVNEVRIQSAVIRDADYLRVGNSVYRVLAGGDPETAYRDEIARLSGTDPLTGLPNRSALEEVLDREVGRAGREGRPVAVILLDVDGLKALNDRLGVAAGDHLLRGVAVRAREALRGGDLLARSGGDDFVAVLAGAGEEPAVRVAERVRRAVAGLPFRVDGEDHQVTVSAGIGVMGPGEQLTPAELLRRADERLDEAKRAGRNCIRPDPRG